MNDLGIAVVWVAARVTVLTGIAVISYQLAARRSPGTAAAVLVTTLGLTLLLCITNLLGIPSIDWRSTRAPDSVIGTANASLPNEHAVTDSAPSEIGVEARGPWDLLRRALGQLQEMRSFQPGAQKRWPMVVAAIFLGGVAIGVARLLLGVWAVWNWRRGSRIVSDEMPSRLLDALRVAMGCRRSVELRESCSIGSAATIGWARPIILLPADWQRWSINELRAVMAHELAHVRRGDFVAVLISRLAEVVHFYHPLVYWLGTRLRMQQELAADALGARFAGGRRIYLQALAGLALREDTRSIGWPARAFLPARGTLMRRIHMLRAKNLVSGTSGRRLGRIVPAMLLLAAGLGAAMLDGPIPKNSPDPEKPKAAEAPQLPAFDLTYIPDGALGVAAFRPAAVFRLPALRQYVPLVNLMLAQSVKEIGLKGEFGLSVDDIEQVVGAHRLMHNPEQPEGQRRSIVTELAMIRTVKPCDWKKQAEAMGATVTEITCEGGSYYKANKLFLPPMMAPKGICFFMPDERTLVINSEDNLKALLRRKPGAIPDSVWAEGWKRVERDLFAVAIDTRSKQLAEIVAKEPINDPIDQLWARLVLTGQQTVFGANGTEEVSLHAWCLCETETGAKEAAKLTCDLYAKGQGELKKAKPTNDNARKLLGVLADLLEHLQIDVDGCTIKWHTKAKPGIAELISVSVSAEFDQVKK